MRIIGSGTRLQTTVNTSIANRGHQRRAFERLAHAMGVSRAEILPGDRRDGEAERHHRHEAGLNDALADAESGLCCRTERTADCVDDEQIHGDQGELNAGRQSNLEDLRPETAARARASAWNFK